MIRILLDYLSQHRDGLFHPVVLGEEICQQHASFKLLRLERQRFFISSLRLVVKIPSAKILRRRNTVGLSQISPCQRIARIKRHRLFQKLDRGLMFMAGNEVATAQEILVRKWILSSVKLESLGLLGRRFGDNSHRSERPVERDD